MRPDTVGTLTSAQSNSEEPLSFLSRAQARELCDRGTHYFVDHGRKLKAKPTQRSERDKRSETSNELDIRDTSCKMGPRVIEANVQARAGSSIRRMVEAWCYA